MYIMYVGIGFDVTLHLSCNLTMLPFSIMLCYCKSRGRRFRIRLPQILLRQWWCTCRFWQSITNPPRCLMYTCIWVSTHLDLFRSRTRDRRHALDEIAAAAAAATKLHWLESWQQSQLELAASQLSQSQLSSIEIQRQGDRDLSISRYRDILQLSLISYKISLISRDTSWLSYRDLEIEISSIEIQRQRDRDSRASSLKASSASQAELAAASSSRYEAGCVPSLPLDR